MSVAMRVNVPIASALHQTLVHEASATNAYWTTVVVRDMADMDQVAKSSLSLEILRLT